MISSRAHTTLGGLGVDASYNRKVWVVCGGQLCEGLATIPFALDPVVVVVKDVPAEICSECNESYMKGDAVDRIEELLQNLKEMSVEVSVVYYKAA